MNPDPFWRHREFLAEAERDRRAMQIPREPHPIRLRLRVRARLARALLAMATWLSPDIHQQPSPALNLARVTRRNGNM